MNGYQIIIPDDLIAAAASAPDIAETLAEASELLLGSDVNPIEVGVQRSRSALGRRVLVNGHQVDFSLGTPICVVTIRKVTKADRR